MPVNFDDGRMVGGLGKWKNWVEEKAGTREQLDVVDKESKRKEQRSDSKRAAITESSATTQTWTQVELRCVVVVIVIIVAVY